MGCVSSLSIVGCCRCISAVQKPRAAPAQVLAALNHMLIQGFFIASLAKAEECEVLGPVPELLPRLDLEGDRQAGSRIEDRHRGTPPERCQGNALPSGWSRSAADLEADVVRASLSAGGRLLWVACLSLSHASQMSW